MKPIIGCGVLILCVYLRHQGRGRTGCPGDSISVHVEVGVIKYSFLGRRLSRAFAVTCEEEVGKLLARPNWHW